MCFYGRFDRGSPISGCLFYVFLWKIWLRQSNFGLPFLCVFMEDLIEAIQFRTAFFMCFYGRFERGSPISDCLFLCVFMEDLNEAAQFRTAFFMCFYGRFERDSPISGCLFYVLLWKIERGSPISDCLFLCGFMEDLIEAAHFRTTFFMCYYGRFDRGSPFSGCLFLCVIMEDLIEAI